MSAITGTWRFTALLREAMESLQDNRLRTALSLLGVAIGIASIIVVGSICTSGREVVFKELETFGLRTFWVFRHEVADEQLQRRPTGTGIRVSDYRDASRLGGAIALLSPVVEWDRSRAFVGRGPAQARARIQGVNADYDTINGDSLDRGRFLSASDVQERAKVAVIGPALVERLYPDGSSPIGTSIAINQDWYVVVGTLAKKSRDVISSLGAAKNEETGSRVLIPYTAALGAGDEYDAVSYLQGQASDIGRASEAIADITRLLALGRGNAYHYAGESMSTYVETADRILGTVGFIGIVAASVSLLVGGLAIMNIMTTSVIERTQEIGVRRAIGATKRAIRLQFLTESILISCAGGAVGVVVGLLAILLLARFSGQFVAPSGQAMFYATLSTFIVGVASGFYPARTASNLEPVEALRHD